ncbi:hypothetical protein ES708_32133 [subsurface metagenome]
MFSKCVALWHLLDEAEQQEWERLATPRHMTGYAWFISQCLRPNPGIYLPLQGGTMSGNIDMDKNRLLKLPEPTDNQEPATKLYVDTLSKIIWKDASQTALSDLDRTVTLTWTELDITARTSPTAKLAIIRLRLKADAVGTGSDSYIAIRKHGTAPAHHPQLRLDKAGTTVGVYNYQVVIIGLDIDRKIDYAIVIGSNWQIDSRIEVLGYIE